MLTPFDTLIDAIVQYSSYTNPRSAVYKARNPGALKNYSVPVKAGEDRPLREFRCDIDGIQALKFDVRYKIAGKSKRQCATLKDLADAYTAPTQTAKAWAGFIRIATGDESVNANTPLTYFQEQK